MSAVKLVIVSCMLTMGMLVLPPLAGAGTGSLVTRLWLALGLLVFSGNYLTYQQEVEQQAAAKLNVHTLQQHLTRQQVRSLK